MADLEKCMLDFRARECNTAACSICGWNPEVDQARRQLIETNGLTQGEDGLRRLIIQKGVETDDSNT